MDETNAQQANSCAKFDVLELGFDYIQTIKEEIQKVTTKDLLECAQKYFNDNYTLSIIKP